MDFQNHKSCSFPVHRGVPQGSVLGPCIFLFLHKYSSCFCAFFRQLLFFYPDNLAIWSFTPWSLLQLMPPMELCFDCSAGMSTGVFFLIRANVRPPSQWIPTKLTSSPKPSYSTPASVSIPLRLFLESLSTVLLPFLNMYLR